jgi:hypothetical protein
LFKIKKKEDKNIIQMYNVQLFSNENKNNRKKNRSEYKITITEVSDSRTAGKLNKFNKLMLQYKANPKK